MFSDSTVRGYCGSDFSHLAIFYESSREVIGEMVFKWLGGIWFFI